MSNHITSECIICHSPLGNESKEDGFLVCHEHRKCNICHKIVSARFIRIIVNQATAREDEITSDLIVHDSCAIQYLDKPSDSGKILTPLAEIDLLNRMRLCFMPDEGLDAKQNEEMAEAYLPSLIKDMSLDGQYLAMRRWQTLSARISIIISKDRNKIQEELKSKHKAEYEEVQAIRQKAKDNPPSDKYHGYSAKTWDNMTKVDKKKVIDREKAIAALTNMGIDLATATASVDKYKR